MEKERQTPSSKGTVNQASHGSFCLPFARLLTVVTHALAETCSPYLGDPARVNREKRRTWKPNHAKFLYREASALWYKVGSGVANRAWHPRLIAEQVAGTWLAWSSTKFSSLPSAFSFPGRLCRRCSRLTYRFSYRSRNSPKAWHVIKAAAASSVPSSTALRDTVEAKNSGEVASTTIVPFQDPLACRSVSHLRPHPSSSQLYPACSRAPQDLPSAEITRGVTKASITRRSSGSRLLGSQTAGHKLALERRLLEPGRKNEPGILRGNVLRNIVFLDSGGWWTRQRLP